MGINWNRNFGVNGTVIRSLELVTDDHEAICKKIGVTDTPSAMMAQVERKYSDQYNFDQNKQFLLRRMIQTGYPFSNTIIRPNGSTISTTAGRNVYQGIFKRSTIENAPSTYSVPFLFEVERIGKCIKLPVDNIKLNGETLLDPVMIITDTWNQRISGVDEPITFISAFAHINGMPESWYAHIHLYIYEDALHLFPENITGKKIFSMSTREKNLCNVILFDIAEISLLKMMVGGLVSNEPIWTNVEDSFELQAPIWFNRFRNHIPEIFQQFKLDMGKSGYNIVVKSANPDYSHTVIANWIVNDSNNGYFNGYVLDMTKNILIYGTFKAFEISGSTIAELIMVLNTLDLYPSDEPLMQTDITYRPGFKEAKHSNASNNHEEKFGVTIDIPNVAKQQNDEVTISVETDEAEVEVVTE